MDLAAEIANGHGYLGYAVLVALLGSVGWGLVRARGGAAYSDGFPRLVGLVLALQWVYGVLVYVQVEAWRGEWPLAYVHPLAMTAAVALAGIATARAGRTPGSGKAAWMEIVRLHGLSLLLVVVGVWAATAG